MPAVRHLFPDIAPTARVYTPGVFPTNEFQSLNGSVTTIQYGGKAVDCKLEMTFANITDDQTWDIFRNYELVMNGRDELTGERDYVDLNGQMKGVQNWDLALEMSQNPESPKPTLRYRYAEPPVITSVFPGRSTVRVVLRGYLDGV